MSRAPEGRRARAVYFDVDSFSFEGFSNGATIQYREMLKRFQSLGIDGAVVTVGQAASSAWAGRRGGGPDRRWHLDQGIAVGEYLLDRDPVADPALYRRVIAAAVAETRPDIVIAHTPPARLEEAELSLFEALAGEGARRLCFVPDHHFPAAGRAAPERLARLKAALRAFSLVAPSRFIAEAVSAAGLGPCALFGNVFDRRAMLAPPRAPDFVTFINPHPMKGVAIFLEIARRLPHRRFQVIRAWPYPPVFACDLPNVVVRPYTPRMAEVWERTAALIVPSLCPEGFGRIVIEAQSNGIPVIAHATGGLPEAAGDGALLVPAPRPRGDPVFPTITEAERDRSAAAFCAHIETVFAGGGDIAALLARARANAEKWHARGERDVARLAAPFAAPPYAAAHGCRPSLLVIAPHPDDAAFAVGGLLRAWRGPKTVLTVFGRSNFTRAEGFADDPAAVSRRRRREDEAYCRRVGASLLAWDLPEASLRRAPCWEAIFAADARSHAAQDQAAADALSSGLAALLSAPPDLLLVPAGLGGHGDHLLVRDIGFGLAKDAGLPLALYEDLPYAATLTKAEIEGQVAALLDTPTLTHAPLSAGIGAKLGDAACYSSQIDREVLDHLARHAARWPEPSERLWSRDPIAPVIARGLMETP